jgi:hypothetical protein
MMFYDDFCDLFLECASETGHNRLDSTHIAYAQFAPLQSKVRAFIDEELHIQQDQLPHRMRT